MYYCAIAHEVFLPIHDYPTPWNGPMGYIVLVCPSSIPPTRMKPPCLMNVLTIWELDGYSNSSNNLFWGRCSQLGRFWSIWDDCSWFVPNQWSFTILIGMISTYALIRYPLVKDHHGWITKSVHSQKEASVCRMVDHHSPLSAILINSN